MDQEYLQYFPSSSPIFYFMKGWEWSSFGYLYKKPAATSKIVMRMILAIAATDISRQNRRQVAEDHGRSHYGLAVQEFRALLAQVDARNISSSELRTIFAIMFLMIIYEWVFGHSVRHLQLHLQGVWCLLNTHPEIFRMQHEVIEDEAEEEASLVNLHFPRDGNERVSVPMLAQLLLWIL
jgi:Amt family ammonium transporter